MPQAKIFIYGDDPTVVVSNGDIKGYKPTDVIIQFGFQGKLGYSIDSKTLWEFMKERLGYNKHP